MKTILIRDAELVSSTELLKVDVLIHQGLIDQIAFHNSPTYALPSIPDVTIDEVIEANRMLLFPGLIDCHVHFREPGFPDKATMKTEAAAARAGGVTTVCEMPNTNPPTVTVAALADKVRRAAEIDDCDIRFFFGITQPEHLIALKELWTGESAELKRLKARCCGLKIYLDHSTGDQKIQDELLDDVFATCAELSIPLVAHCEDPAMNKKLTEENTSADIAAHSNNRPAASEEKSIREAIERAKKFKTPLHIAHLSTKGGVDAVRQAKKEGLPITCEVAPHHLFFTTDDYAALGTFIKMNPPIRSREHQQALWDGIHDGTVDCISTDHAPHTLAEKQNPEPLKAPSGVPGVETMIPLLLSVANGTMKDYQLMMPDIVRLCFDNPNQIFSLGKKEVAEGAPADLVLVDPDQPWTIHGKDLHSKCGWTPFEGWEIRGKVVRVFQ